MALPSGTQAVRKGGRTYYYYAPHRGTERAGERVSLGSDPADPEFWKRLRAAIRGDPQAIPKTFDALILDYRASPEWVRLRPGSKETYGRVLDRISRYAGDRLVSAMTKADVYSLRNGLQDRPNLANYLLSVLRTIIELGIQCGYCADNPVIGVKRIEVEPQGARPWPEEAYRHVLASAPTEIRRLAFLGRATGQRNSDVLRMRAADLERDGINMRIGKLRDRPHFVPLTAAQMAEILSWGAKDMEFLVARPDGRRYSRSGFKQIWARWRDDNPLAAGLTLHGLRATAVADRRAAGTEDGAIADEIGMSRQMVSRYVRFADKAASARASRDRREARR